MKPYYIILFLSIFSSSCSMQQTKVLKSPNGNLSLIFQLSKKGELSYSFDGNNTQFIENSSLGYKISSEADTTSIGWTLKNTIQNSKDSVWNPLWGKRKVVPEQYNEILLDFEGDDQSEIRFLRIEARAYNDGVAFRYLIPRDKNNIVAASTELTTFNFSEDYTAWYYNGEHENIGPERLSETNDIRQPVMTVMVDENNYLAIHEADLRSGDPLLLKSNKGETLFKVASKPSSAWRVLMYGETPGDLVDSHILELLNPAPPKDADFSWVTPGVAVWDWRINGAEIDDFKYEMSLPSWIRMVDFASENNIPHLVLDADWYGPEFGEDSDPVKGGKVLEVHEIIKYAKAKGVGVWLYLNDVGGRNYPLEQTLKQYGDWGAAGIKYGFMSGTPSERNLRTRKITELCAQNQLLCNFHDGPVHPYGQMRTFPNAVTREYCHSQLDAHRVYMPSTFVTSVFVNMLAGPIDMCNGFADLMQTGRVDEPSAVPSTLTGEMARTLIVFSGATIIPDIPENYRKHPELLQFLASEKMPWRESKTLSGKIGEHIVMARQAADGKWLVGAATNEDSRELDIPLSFLSNGSYKALIIQDGENSDYRTHHESYKTNEQTVTSTDILHVKLAPGGGSCVLLTKID